MKFIDDNYGRMAFMNNERENQYVTSAGKLMEPKHYIKDLGIVVEDILGFHQHINTAAKVSQMFGWLT